jgi:putative ABC transport system permease protein
VMAFAVNQRTQEFGVRMALGADRWNIVSMVLREGGFQLLIGIKLGLGLAVTLVWIASGTLNGFLFGVGPFHPPTYALVIGLLTVVALLSCLVPALRATKVDPMVALRAE